ncbi:hypothetical protein EON66_09905, partial [archaeon]
MAAQTYPFAAYCFLSLKDTPSHMLRQPSSSPLTSHLSEHASAVMLTRPAGSTSATFKSASPSVKFMHKIS